MYKCLVLDHDDTVVDSSASIHYPSFIEYLKIYSPHLVDNYDLATYFRKNFHPGILELFTDEVGLNAEELKEEEAFWRAFVANHIPSPYEGIKEIIADFRAQGGVIAVASHSFRHYIERDYAAAGIPVPELIYGWEQAPENRKPSPYAVLDVIDRLNLSPDEVLVVDDLKPGYDMARAAGVDFAAAGWAYDVPEIEDFMRENCDYYLKSVSDLRLLLGL